MFLVVLADANDLDFWTNLNEKTVEVIILAMPKHHSNIEAAKQIKNLNLDCQIYAVARFDEEVEELQSLGVTAFHIYTEAGVGLARQTYKTYRLKSSCIESRSFCILFIVKNKRRIHATNSLSIRRNSYQLARRN